MSMLAVSFAALAIVATANAFPVLDDDLRKWGNEIVWGGNRIQLGLGWSVDGTVAAGAKIWAGDSVPVAAAVSSNINNLKNVEYEIGAGVQNSSNPLTTGNVVVAGNNDGKLKYSIGAVLPRNGQSIIGSILGDHAEIKTIGVSVSDSLETLSASLDLDNYKPQSASIDFGSSRTV